MITSIKSYKDFTQATIKQIALDSKAEIDLSSENGKEIHGSCFYREGFPFQDLAKAGISNITFIGCNLDNCIVPKDCTMIDCCNRFIRALDKDDWLCNSEGVFIEKFSVGVING